MEITLGERIKHAWNAFLNREPIINRGGYNYGSYSRPDRIRLTRGNERSIVTSVSNFKSINTRYSINYVR